MKAVKLIAVSSTIVLFTACSHANQNASAASDTTSVRSTVTQRSDSTSLDKDKSELKTKLDTLIVNANARIDELDKKMRKASVKERKSLEADKTNMEEKRDALKKDLDDVDKKADAGWKEFKESVLSDMDSTKKNLKI